VAHTADVGSERLEQFHRLLIDAFAEDTEHPFSADDWSHCLGGVHVWVESEDGAPVAHGCVVSRRMLHAGRVLRCGYVEGMAVRTDLRGQGLAHRVLRDVERIVRDAYELGTLGATDKAASLYRSHGWEPWRGALSAITPEGIRPTPDDEGGVYVLAGAGPLDLDRELTCDWREGDLW
jgi:aminoglycoside 2'-N-acetyltransferase I